jgi:HPt (histidine-containing phosphotransfer) domain-containing protein
MAMVGQSVSGRQACQRHPAATARCRRYGTESRTFTRSWNDQRGTLPVEAQLNDISSPAFLPDELLARCLGKTDLMKRILCKFRETFVKDYELLENGVEQYDIDHVALVAHRLKGAAANIGAPVIREIATTIEKKAREKSLDGTKELLQILHTEWQRFSECIGEFV